MLDRFIKNLYEDKLSPRLKAFVLFIICLSMFLINNKFIPTLESSVPKYEDLDFYDDIGGAVLWISYFLIATFYNARAGGKYLLERFVIINFVSGLVFWIFVFVPLMAVGFLVLKKSFLFGLSFKAVCYLMYISIFLLFYRRLAKHHQSLVIINDHEKLVEVENDK